MKIHAICIQKKSGVLAYHQNFSEIFEKTNFTLVSSFVAALLQFSSSVVEESINVMDMGSLRFFFREFNGVIFLMISDNTSSSLLINERMERMAKQFFEMYSPESVMQMDHIIEDENLSTEFDKIVGFSDDYSDVKIDQLRELFEKEMFKGEITAGSILSLQGDIYYSSLPINILHTSLKEIEIRTQTDPQLVELSPKQIWQSEKHMIFSQICQFRTFHTPVYVILLFSSDITLGMADFTLEDIISKLEANL